MFIINSDQLRRTEIYRDLLVDSFKNFSRAVDKNFSRAVEQTRIEENQADTASSTNVLIIQAPFPPTHRSNPPILFIAASLVARVAAAGVAILLLSSLRETFLCPENGAHLGRC